MVRQKSLKATELENRLIEAMQGIKSGRFKSSYEAGKVLQLSRNTVTERVKGRNSRVQARYAQQKLSYDQENTLLKWIKYLTSSGYSPGHQLLKEVAEEIRSGRDYTLRDAIPTSPNTSLLVRNHLLLGQDWVPRFVQRHPHLKVVIGRRIESVRMDGATKPAIDAWFVAYEEIVRTLKIKPHNTYNMDESGFSIGTMDSTRIIIDSTLRTKYQAHPGRQEWVSFVECICGDNTILDTFGIFKGKNVLQGWIPYDLIDKWYFSANSKGWTSNLHGLEWLRRVFDPQSRTKANGEYRLLVCDGHDSHISGSFIAYCIQNKIALLILPPHTSHILQPLDISIFGPLKKRLTAALQPLSQAQLVRIQKIEWLEAYKQARLEACTAQNIKSAWRGSGMIPFNPIRALRTIDQGTLALPETPATPSRFDIFNQVFVNSSPPDISTLHKANELLKATLRSRTLINSPIRGYIEKLASGSERLHTQNTIHQHDARNLRSIVKKRTTRKSGKRLVLSGHFHISTQELLNGVKKAEQETKERAAKKGKMKGEDIVQDAESEDNDEKEAIDESESDIEDCIIVDVD